MSEHLSHQEKRTDTDTYTDEALFHIALTDADEDVAWRAIAELHLRGDRNIFEHACKLCISEEARARRVGADILGQLGVKPGQSGHAFHAETMATLLKMLELEQTPQVLNSIAVAPGHRRDPQAIEPLLRFKSHPDAFVRLGVVHCLSGHEHALAIQTLLDLSTDLDADVRDWATFGLGSLLDVDTPAIRAALLARLRDENGDIRGEAMVGLARRHDQRMVQPLLDDLQAGYSGSLLMEAASEIGDSRLYPALVRLQETWEGDRDNWRYQELEEAIVQCRSAAENM